MFVLLQRLCQVYVVCGFYYWSCLFGYVKSNDGLLLAVKIQSLLSECLW